jgi:iron-sulfur cluster assembly protein|tara:strand:- start:385 stop:744 length:360 start_codon:yes stop_codon:yes gene_type:complete
MTIKNEVRKTPAVLNVTEAASAQLKKLIENHSSKVVGIRLAVNEGGCNGFTYAMDFAETKNEADEVMELDGVCLLIDPMALMYLVGTEMDFVVEKLSSNFVFRNPNESGRCGCGESFSV